MTHARYAQNRKRIELRSFALDTACTLHDDGKSEPSDRQDYVPVRSQDISLCARTCVRLPERDDGGRLANLTEKSRFAVLVRFTSADLRFQPAQGALTRAAARSAPPNRVA
jgi:hypothetical protein